MQALNSRKIAIYVAKHIMQHNKGGCNNGEFIHYYPVKEVIRKRSRIASRESPSQLPVEDASWYDNYLMSGRAIDPFTVELGASISF